MLGAGSTESPPRSTESSRRPAEPPATNPVDRSFRAAGLRALAALLGLVALVIISTPSPPRDPLLAALGALFSPERGRVLGNAISLFAAIVELAGVALFLAGRSGAPSAAGSDRGPRDDFSSLADRIARIEDEVIVRRLLSAGIEVLRWNLARGLDSLRVREKGARV